MKRFANDTSKHALLNYQFRSDRERRPSTCDASGQAHSKIQRVHNTVDLIDNPNNTHQTTEDKMRLVIYTLSTLLIASFGLNLLLYFMWVSWRDALLFNVVGMFL